MYQWNDKYLIGDTNIDNQHRRFFDMINNLENATNKSNSELSLMIIFLQDYADRHFLDEEKYMADHQYPDLEKHQEYHQNFKLRVEQLCLQAREHSSTQEMATTISKMMGNWLEEHIITVDLAISTFIKTGERVVI